MSSFEWWHPSGLDEIEPRAWLHPAAALYFGSLLRPEMDVIEHGCGGSTLWLADRVRSVRSYEHNNDWAEVLQLQVPQNARVYSGDGIPSTHKADLLFIDGFNQNRPMWLEASRGLVKDGGIIVLDNAERAHYQKGREYLSSFCHHPCQVAAYTDYGKLCITEFWRVKGGVKWI